MDFIESDCLELKAVINNDFKKEIIAFANTNGCRDFPATDGGDQLVKLWNLTDICELVTEDSVGNTWHSRESRMSCFHHHRRAGNSAPLPAALRRARYQSRYGRV